jgi:hypothetical protein
MYIRSSLLLHVTAAHGPSSGNSYCLRRPQVQVQEQTALKHTRVNDTKKDTEMAAEKNRIKISYKTN